MSISGIKTLLQQSPDNIFSTLTEEFDQLNERFLAIQIAYIIFFLGLDNEIFRLFNLSLYFQKKKQLRYPSVGK